MQGITQEFNDINNITPSAKEWEMEHTRVLDTHALRECKRWASKALWRISHDAAGHVQDILAEGIKLLLKTMTARLDDLQVQEHACRVLQNLGGNEQRDAQHSIRCIAAAGGISLLLKVLAAHKGSSAVLGQACGAISNLAREQEYRLEMVEHGVIELLLAAMDMHPTSPALQERACGALLNIGWSREDGAVLQYIHAKGGAARLEAAMLSEGATFKTRKWANSLLAKIISQC